jgi:hypothetical protein
MSVKAPDSVIRPALVLVLLLSGLKLIGASNATLGIALALGLAGFVGSAARFWIVARAAAPESPPPAEPAAEPAPGEPRPLTTP